MTIENQVTGDLALNQCLTDFQKLFSSITKCDLHYAEAIQALLWYDILKKVSKGICDDVFFNIS